MTALSLIQMVSYFFSLLPSQTTVRDLKPCFKEFNPLHTNVYRKSLSLRQTKTDKVDAHTITLMMMSDVNLKSYSNTSYHNEELKSLTRCRFDKVKEWAKQQ